MRPEASNNPKVVSDLVSLTLFHTKSQGAKNRVKPLENYRLWVKYSDGVEGVVDPDNLR
jgi:hypothetical protein